MEARYSEGNKNCTQEKQKGLKSEIFTLCNIVGVILCTYVSGLLFSTSCIVFVLQFDFSVYLCYFCCSIF